MNFAAIKAAEQWSLGSVALALLVVVLTILWFLRNGRRH